MQEEKAAYEAMQVIAEAEQQAATTVASAVPEASKSTTEDAAMDVDSTPALPSEGGTKRKAEDDAEQEASKKPRMGEYIRCALSRYSF